jgi:hypothetical protein
MVPVKVLRASALALERRSTVGMPSMTRVVRATPQGRKRWSGWMYVSSSRHSRPLDPALHDEVELDSDGGRAGGEPVKDARSNPPARVHTRTTKALSKDIMTYGLDPHRYRYLRL